MSRHRDVMGDAFAMGEAEETEAVDPMSGLTNLVDCMLVLACGLMVSLVVHWNLSMAPQYEVLEETGDLIDLEEGEDPELAVRDESNPESGGEDVYENLGTLYRDSETGRLYYLRENTE